MQEVLYRLDNKFQLLLAQSCFVVCAPKEDLALAAPNWDPVDVANGRINKLLDCKLHIWP
jgi:hypothetical protein